MGWLSNTVFYVLSALPILFTAVQVVQLDYLKRLDTSLKGFQCTELFREEVSAGVASCFHGNFSVALSMTDLSGLP